MWRGGTTEALRGVITLKGASVLSEVSVESVVQCVSWLSPLRGFRVSESPADKELYQRQIEADAHSPPGVNLAFQHHRVKRVECNG